ncbi:MAG: sigma 54-interacting transcriptional regulator [Firmicutes bacterium]|nr:sigma 54-interacting transcriptional regulator [Bacillota bacterium]
MGRAKLGFIAFTPEQVAAALAAARSLAGRVTQPLAIETAEAADPESVFRAGRILERTCQAILASPGIAAELERALSVPVVRISLPRAELLDALYRASRKGRKVATILHAHHECQLGVWPTVLGIQVRQIQIQNREQARQAVAQCKEHGFEVLVGGTMVGRYAREHGLEHELVGMGEESIRHALEKAADLVDALEREREENLRFQALLDAADQGVVFVDKEGTAKYANDLAFRILGLRRAALLGNNLLSAMSDSLTPEAWRQLAQALGEKDPVRLKGSLLRYRDGSGIVVTSTAIVATGGRLGTLLSLTEVSRLQRVEARVRRQLAEAGLVAKYHLEDILGTSPAITQARLQAKAYAATDAAVLVCGETGTGKELFAHAIHNLSPRAAGPFVAINCSALPKELMESELFGYEEGAFTGTRKGGKQGLFELAHGGTIFLDEVGTMPLESQARLLRVIQEKEVIRVGGTRMIPVDVRVIAATNCDLTEKVNLGEFRQDLFFRLSVLVLEVPPLRARPQDVPVLFLHFLQQVAPDMCRQLTPLDQEITAMLQRHHWAGNVRELQNLAHRFAALARQHPGDPRRLLEATVAEALDSHRRPPYPWAVTAKPVCTQPPGTAEVPYRDALREAERTLLHRVGEQANWNRKEMARLLGVSTTTLWRKLKRAGISDFRVMPVAHTGPETD